MIARNRLEVDVCKSHLSSRKVGIPESENSQPEDVHPIEGYSVMRPLRTATRRSWQPGGFGDSCLPDGIFHGALDYRFVEVMPTPDDGLAVGCSDCLQEKPIANPTRGLHSDTCARWHGSATPPVPVARSRSCR